VELVLLGEPRPHLDLDLPEARQDEVEELAPRAEVGEDLLTREDVTRLSTLSTNVDLRAAPLRSL